MTKKENSTEKENFKVRNIYDREGFSEATIMEESEIYAAVEKWLEDNTFQEIIKDNGFSRYDQTFGRTQCVSIDTRDGGITHRTHTPNETWASEPFYIDLVIVGEYDPEDQHICEGADMVAELTVDQLIKIAEYVDHEEDIEIYLEAEKLDSGKHEVRWWDNCHEIPAEKWVTHIEKEDWDEWVSTYEDHLLEDIHHDWEDKVAEHYQELRDYPY